MTPSYFIGELDLCQLGDGRNFKTCTPFGLWTERFGAIMVPVGMGTDLASIPRELWIILPPFGQYTDAAVIHDCLYRTKPAVTVDGITRQITREEADWCLLEGMKIAGVEVLKRDAIYDGVRCFGHVAWEDDSRLALVNGQQIQS